MKDIVKKIFFGGLLALLVIPMINSYVRFIPLKPLSGVIESSPDTVLNANSWFSGRYQIKKDDFVKDSFGCRNLFIRIHNQLIYSLADKQTVNDVIIGKDGYSFSLGQAQTYSGEIFPGVKNMVDQVDKLKYIQDTLAKLNKTLVVVFAGGTVIFYPEFLPDKYKNPDNVNAYTCYAALFKYSGVNLLDFNKYFDEQKSKSPYKFFTYNSLHWTKYASCLAGDSLLSFIERYGNYKLNHSHWDSLVLSEADGTEIENEEDMNLLFKLKRDKLAHPKLSFKPDTGANRPSVLFVGDSYFWGLKRVYNIWNAFSDAKFIYYYKKVYTKGSDETKSVVRLNLQDEIKKNNVFVIVCSEGNYPSLGWGFIDDMYGVFHGKAPLYPEYHKKVDEIKNGIKNDPKWLINVEKNAKEKGISVDSAMTLEATWIIEH